MDEEERMDLLTVCSRMMRGVEKGWKFLLIASCILVLTVYVFADRSYTPIYTTSATVYVQLAGGEDNSYRDRISAAQLELFIPYLWDSGVLKEAVCRELGQELIPGEIGISVSPDTNLLTVQVTGAEADKIYRLLEAFIKTVPGRLQSIVGPLDFITFRSMGIPRYPANEKSSERKLLLRSVRQGGRLFVGGLLGLMLYGTTLQIIYDRKMLARCVNVPVLGCIPHIGRVIGRKEKHWDSERWKHISSRISEPVKMLRSRLDKLMEQEKVLLITGSAGREGRSLVTASLAIALWQKGKKVMVINGGRENTDVTQMLQAWEEYSMRRETGDIRLGSSIKIDSNEKCRKQQKKRIETVSLNQFKRKDSKLLEVEQFQRFMEEQRKDRDYILIDAPAADTGDTLFLCRYAEGCLYVVRRGQAEQAQVRMGVNLLAESGCRILGTVLNDVREKGGGCYGNRYGYGRSAEKNQEI